VTPPAIFVFGSNRLGIHGAGAALRARNQHGAQTGVGEGPTGHAYAIPTKATPHTRLSLDEIRTGVDAFLTYARSKPELQFQVTRIGCGLAGYTDADIAPLFKDAPANCLLPTKPVNWRTC
jgi:hypothetical protein